MNLQLKEGREHFNEWKKKMHKETGKKPGTMRFDKDSFMKLMKLNFFQIIYFEIYFLFKDYIELDIL